MLTFAVYLQDHPGALNRVASLFRRRAFNISSLTVGHTEQPGVSRMTIVVDAPDAVRSRIEANLYKLLDVERVESIPPDAAVDRDLAMIKVAATRHVARRDHAARRRLPRARRRRRQRVAHRRDHGHRRQDRRPARRAQAVRRDRNGPDRPRLHVARRTGTEGSDESDRERSGSSDGRPRPAFPIRYNSPWPPSTTTATPLPVSSARRRSQSSATAPRATPTR